MCLWQLKLIAKWIGKTKKWATAWQNQQNDLCAQQTFISAWASTQSDQSLRCPHEETLGPKLPIERTVKTDQTGQMPGLICLRWAGRPYWTQTWLCLIMTVASKCMEIKWTASSEFGTYCQSEQRRFRRACASAQSHQNLRYSLVQAVSQEEPSDRKPDPRPLWMAGHVQLKFVMSECSKTQIRLTGLKYWCLQVKPLSRFALLYSMD